MKKIGVFLLVLFSWVSVHAQQNPVVASQPYKFMKWVSIADSLILNNPKLGTYTGHLTFKPNGTVGLDTVKYANGTITFTTDFTYISNIVGLNLDTITKLKADWNFIVNGHKVKSDSGYYAGDPATTNGYGHFASTSLNMFNGSSHNLNGGFSYNTMLFGNGGTNNYYLVSSDDSTRITGVPTIFKNGLGSTKFASNYNDVLTVKDTLRFTANEGVYKSSGSNFQFGGSVYNINSNLINFHGSIGLSVIDTANFNSNAFIGLDKTGQAGMSATNVSLQEGNISFNNAFTAYMTGAYFITHINGINTANVRTGIYLRRDDLGFSKSGIFVYDDIDSIGMRYKFGYQKGITDTLWIPYWGYVKKYVDSHSGTGTVTAVSGTTNRITSTGGTTPIIDISASYVGQTSITTLGTISTGSIPYSLITGTPTLPTGATPTASIGFTAVAGLATSFTRSDGAAKADSTIIRSVANSYSLSGLQTKFNLYLPLTGGTLTGPLGITSATTPQITITNGSGTAIFSEASGGNLTITPSGSTTITGSATVTGTLGVNSFMSSSTSSNLYVQSAVSAVSTSASQWEFIPSTSNFLRVGAGGNNSTTLAAGQTYSSFLLNGMGVTSVATGTANPWIVGAAVLAPVITNGGVAPTNGTALYIGGATSNAANNYALYSASGTNFFGGTATNTQALAASATADGYDLVNSTIAVTGSNVYNSPFLHYTVQGFASTPAASRSIDAEVSIASAQGTANPTGQMTTQWLINGSAGAGIWTMTSAGVNVFTGGSMTNKNFNTAANNVDGIISLTTTASTSGTTANWAPTFTQTGTWWNTSGTPASNVGSMRQGLQFVSGSTFSGIETWAFGSGVSTPSYSSSAMTLTNTGILSLPIVGSELKIGEGSGGFVGQTTLVTGTKAITITGVTTSSRALVQLVTPSGVALTTSYQAVCTANTITIQANVAAGTINSADGSTLNYFIFN